MVPKTTVINKPLLARSLQHRFGFCSKPGGVEVAILAPDMILRNKHLVHLYSPSGRSLEGAFNEQDRRSHRIKVLPARPMGDIDADATTPFSVCCEFDGPQNKAELASSVSKSLGDAVYVSSASQSALIDGFIAYCQ